jgi:site-specific DNA-cytosine methylase
MKRTEKSNFFRNFYSILSEKNIFSKKEIFIYENVQSLIKNKTKIVLFLRK